MNPMTTTMTRLVALMLCLPMFTACIVVDDDRNRRRTTSDRVVVEETETEVVVEDRTTRPGRDVVVEEEVIVEEEEVVVVEETWGAFTPLSASVSSEIIDEDPSFGTSWQLYSMTFSEDESDEVCGWGDGFGDSAKLSLAGFETDNIFAACPVGRYEIVPGCDLFEGEACLSVELRDRGSLREIVDVSTGVVDVTLRPAEFVGEPHLCEYSTFVDGAPELSFEYSVPFEDYEMSPESFSSAPLCIVGRSW